MVPTERLPQETPTGRTVSEKALFSAEFTGCHAHT